MSMDLDARLQAIQAKLLQVLKEYQHLQKENAQLKKELLKAEHTVAERDQRLQSMQQQVDVMKLGVSTWDIEEKKELEKRIDTYLKEIDKCINLLNT